MAEERPRGFILRTSMPIYRSCLPQNIRQQIEQKLNDMGLRLAEYAHYRLTNSSEYRFRVGDYRIIYEFNIEQNEIYVLAVGNRDKIYKRR